MGGMYWEEDKLCIKEITYYLYLYKKLIYTNALKSITQIHLLGNIPLSPMRQAPIFVVCVAMRTSKTAPMCMYNKEGQFGAA